MNKIDAIETMEDVEKIWESEFPSPKAIMKDGKWAGLTEGWIKPQFGYSAFLHAIICSWADEYYVFGLSRKDSLDEWMDNLYIKYSFNNKTGARVSDKEGK